MTKRFEFLSCLFFLVVILETKAGFSENNNNIDPAIFAALALASRNNDRARHNIPNIIKVPIKLKNQKQGASRSLLDLLIKNDTKLMEITNGIEINHVPSTESAKNLFELFAELLKKMN